MFEVLTANALCEHNTLTQRRTHCNLALTLESIVTLNTNCFHVLLGAVVIEVSPKVLTVTEGERASFECRVTQGLSVLEHLSWNPDDGHITVLDFSTGKITLTIEEARENQQFACEAIGTGSSARDTVLLNVVRECTSIVF